MTLVAIAVLIIFFAGALLWFSKGSGLRDLHKVDLAAFRNLLSPDDEAFLKAQLAPRQYAAVRRMRMRAVQEYLMWISEDCAIVLSELRRRANAEDLELPVEMVAATATVMKIRLLCICYWSILWMEYLLPGMTVSPLRALRAFEAFQRRAEKSLAVHS